MEQWENAYFSIENRVQDMRILLFAVVSCFLLSTAYDFIKCFPDGDVIVLELWARWAVAALAIAFLALGLLTAFRGRVFTKMLWVFVGLFVGGAAAILFYSIEGGLQWGAMLIAACNSVRDTFKWYIIVAIMSLGKRDSYLYAALVWLVFQLPVVVDTLMRWLLALPGPMVLEAPMMSSLVALFLVLGACTLVVGLGAVIIAQQKDPQYEPSGFIRSLIGEDSPVSMRQLREEATAQEIRGMGKTFMLSEREMEVASLYVLGHTQNAIAEELCISKTTVHTHIHHIYEKTGIRSRQGLIDYLKMYGG